MKRIPTIFCLSIHTVYYIFAILSLGDYNYVDGVGTGFKFWIYAIIVAIFCVIVHFIESAYQLLADRQVFNVIKFIIVLPGVPLLILVGASAGTVNSIIWNIYFTIVFIFQIASLFIKEK